MRRITEPAPFSIEVAVRDDHEAQEVTAILGLVVPMLRDRADRVTAVLDATLPPTTLLGRGAIAQARRNAVLREAIAAEHGLLSAGEVAAMAGSRASNTAQTATRWRQSGKIFAVVVGTSNLYPGFQFDSDGAPLPAIGAVLAVLGAELKGWELAAWFTSPLDDLAGRTPLAACRQGDVAEVLDAAGYLISTLSE